MIIFGSGTTVIDLGKVTRGRCTSCQQDRALRLCLRYRYLHIYFLLKCVTRKEYMQRCPICGHAMPVATHQVEQSLGKCPIPFMDRYGLLIVPLVFAVPLTVGAIGSMMGLGGGGPGKGAEQPGVLGNHDGNAKALEKPASDAVAQDKTPNATDSLDSNPIFIDGLKQANELIRKFDQLSDALSRIDSAESARDAHADLARVSAEMGQVVERIKSLPKPPRNRTVEFDAHLEGRIGPRRIAATNRFTGEIRRVMRIPDAWPAIADCFSPELSRFIPRAPRNPPANRAVGQGDAPPPFRKPEKPVFNDDLPERAKGAFTFDDAAKGLDYLRAEQLVGSDDALAGQLLWCEALKRPATSLFLGVGAELTGAGVAAPPPNLLGNRKPAASPRPSAFDQHQRADNLKKLTGDVGLMLSQGLQARIDQGDFGQWGQQWKRADSKSRGLMLLENAGQEQLLTSAQSQRLDLLLTFSLEQKRGEGGQPNTIMTVRLHNVVTRALLWESQPLRSQQVKARAGAGGKDPDVKLVENALTYIDEHVRLRPLPALKAAQVQRRAEKLAGEELISPLARLVELRYYRAQGLLNDDEAQSAYEKILGPAEGKLLASGEPAERRKAIEKLLSR